MGGAVLLHQAICVRAGPCIAAEKTLIDKENRGASIRKFIVLL